MSRHLSFLSRGLSDSVCGSEWPTEFIYFRNVVVTCTLTLYLPCYPVLLLGDLSLRLYQLHSMSGLSVLFIVPLCLFNFSFFLLIFSLYCVSTVFLPSSSLFSPCLGIYINKRNYSVRLYWLISCLMVNSRIGHTKWKYYIILAFTQTPFMKHNLSLWIVSISLRRFIVEVLQLNFKITIGAF